MLILVLFKKSYVDLTFKMYLQYYPLLCGPLSFLFLDKKVVMRIFVSGKAYVYFSLNGVIQGADTQNISQLKTKFQCTNTNTKQAMPSDKNASKPTSAYLS